MCLRVADRNRETRDRAVVQSWLLKLGGAGWAGQAGSGGWAPCSSAAPSAAPIAFTNFRAASVTASALAGSLCGLWPRAGNVGNGRWTVPPVDGVAFAGRAVHN